MKMDRRIIGGETENSQKQGEKFSIFQTFILRARVLKLYRQAIRVAKRAPAHSKGDLMHTIRQEMEKNRDCNDKQKIRYLISDGIERLKGLDEMLDMQGH